MGLGHCCCQTPDRHLLVETDRNNEDRIVSVRVIGVFRIILYTVCLDPLIVGAAELDPRSGRTFCECDFRACDLNLSGAARNSKHGRHIYAVFKCIRGFLIRSARIRAGRILFCAVINCCPVRISGLGFNCRGCSVCLVSCLVIIARRRTRSKGQDHGQNHCCHCRRKYLSFVHIDCLLSVFVFTSCFPASCFPSGEQAPL